LQETDQQNNDGEHQKQMDQATADRHHKGTKHPEYDEDNDNSF
jgi:hypothetical protein